MSLDLSNLTDSAQKEYSKLLKDIKFHKGVIEKCKVYSKETPSDALKRARAGYEHNKRQYDDHDTILEERIERMISKLREEGARDKESKAKYLQASEEKLESLENEKSRQQVNAELDLAKAQQQLDKLLDNFRIQPKPTQPPLTQAPEPLEVLEPAEESEDNGYRAFMTLDFNKPEKPLTFIDNNYSYCTTKEAGEKYKGLKGLVPAATNYDSNIYGLVSELKAKKQVKRTGVKA